MSLSLPFIYGENYQDIILRSLEMFIASSSSPLCNREQSFWLPELAVPIDKHCPIFPTSYSPAIPY